MISFIFYWQNAYILQINSSQTEACLQDIHFMTTQPTNSVAYTLHPIPYSLQSPLTD
jgi:hypothetical protein